MSYQIYAVEPPSETSTEISQNFPFPTFFQDSNSVLLINGQPKGSNNSVTNKKRELRLFISSTFRDMNDERDYLVKFVFPQVKQLAHDRGVFFSDIDLRYKLLFNFYFIFYCFVLKLIYN